MKKIIMLMGSLLLLVVSASGQNIHTTEIKDKNLISVLGFADTVIFKYNEDILVKLFKVNNGSGSAHAPETDEVSHRYIIVVSNYDDAPDIRVYSIGDFYNPKILKFEKPASDKFRVLFEYGGFNQRKKAFINISLNKVSVTSL
jgi:hypothetical protein